MAAPQQPYYDLVLEELSSLDNVSARSMFGHAGYAFGNSVFAFFDEDRLVVRTEQFRERDLPSGLAGFYPGTEEMSRVWIGITLDDSLSALRTYWHLIEESYRSAVRREESKVMRSKAKPMKPVRRRAGK